MARVHGKEGAFYIAVDPGGSPQPVAYLTKWDAEFDTEQIDVTAFGDSNRVYLTNLQGATGRFNGWYDTETAQIYEASQDGQPRHFYLYPSLTMTDRYWFGVGLLGFVVSGGVSEGVGVAGAWAASELTAMDEGDTWDSIDGSWADQTDTWASV